MQHAFVQTPCGEALQRVRAPALGAYRFPLDTVASGVHRTTGVLLSVGFPAVVLASLAPPLRSAAGYRAALTAAHAALPRPVWLAAKACVAFPLCYHLLAGARFLAWEHGLLGFDPRATRTTSALLLGGSAAATAVLAFRTFPFAMASQVPQQPPQARQSRLARWLPTWLRR